MKIKSSIGASGLSKMCIELEKAGKAISAGDNPEENMDIIRRRHPDVMALYAQVTVEAKKHLE